MSTDDPYRELREPVLATAATLTPPTAAGATRRLHRRRARRAGVASVAVVLVVASGVGLAGRAPERELTAAGLPIGGSTGTAPSGTYPGTVPGTAPERPVPDETEVAGGDTTTTSTTAPSEEAAGEEPTTTTTAPSDPSEAFAGTYEGVGHYSTTTPECPDITQDLDLTMALDDGSIWTLRADYCATTDANGLWRGDGPFTITTADGSTLVGSLVSEAQLPTGGVPYGLVITGGTGAFDGAEGSCSVTVSLEDLAFGVQRNIGTFDCTVQR